MMIGDQLGWVLMEAPAVLMDWVWLVLWESRYPYRAFIYPELRRSARRPTPLRVVVMGTVQRHERLPERTLPLCAGDTVSLHLAC